MKKTIRRWIIFIFTFLLLITMVVTAWFIYRDVYHDMLNNSKYISNGCAEIVSYLLDQEPPEKLTDPSNEKAYAHARNIMRRLSKSYGFVYMYVYTVDPDTKVRKYVVCVASDDETDKYISEVRGPGSESDAPLDEWETSALEGSLKEEPDFQNTEFGKTLVWVYPYTDKDGKVKALISMDYDYQISKHDFVKKMAKIFLPTVFILTIIFLVLLLMINKRIAVPLHQISGRMNSFVSDRNKPAVPLNVRSVEEINEIAASFEKMSGDISNYLQNIEALTQERVQSRLQMTIARKIQNGLVPEKIDFTKENLSISAVTCPAREVGGDFYDCFQLDENRFCVFMGDVSGKGISAALFMAIAKTTIRENLKTGKTCAEALNIANNELCSMNPEGLFVTAFAAILNLQTGELQYANAGHTFPVMLGQDVRLLRPEPGIVLGLFDDAEIQDETMHLKTGQGILLYTDGVTEAVNDQHVFFGENRLLEVLKKDGGTTASHTIEEISGAVKTFSGNSGQFDDIAMLALWYMGAAKEEMWEELPVNFSSFDIIKKKVLSMTGETEPAKNALLACDEILANIVRYSKADRLAFCCTEEEQNLIVRFSDNGISFDPVGYSSEEKPFDSLDEGGMGLIIVRQTVRDMQYERVKDNNIITLIFSL